MHSFLVPGHDVEMVTLRLLDPTCRRAIVHSTNRIAARPMHSIRLGKLCLQKSVAKTLGEVPHRHLPTVVCRTAMLLLHLRGIDDRLI